MELQQSRVKTPYILSLIPLNSFRFLKTIVINEFHSNEMNEFWSNHSVEYDYHIFSKYLVFQMKTLVFQSQYVVFRSKTLDFELQIQGVKILVFQNFWFEIPSIRSKSKVYSWRYFEWNTRIFIWNTGYFENMWQAYSIPLTK